MEIYRDSEYLESTARLIASQTQARAQVASAESALHAAEEQALLSPSGTIGELPELDDDAGGEEVAEVGHFAGKAIRALARTVEGRGVVAIDETRGGYLRYNATS